MTEQNSPSGILVVDDEAFFRGLLSDMLKQNGYAVIAEAASGEEAVAKFRELSPALVMMDIYMPGVPEQSPGAPCIVWMRNDVAGPRDISVCGDLAAAGFVVASIDF